MAEPFLLPASLEFAQEAKAKLTRLYEGDVLADPKANPAAIAAEEFGLDVSARYGPRSVAHPFGKASGQLSLQRKQVEADAEAGLAFVVLKTVIAEDAGGEASMEAWKIKKPRMEVEPIDGRRVGRRGWTVSWAGRGWEGSLESYCDFMREALAIGAEAAMPVVPSCKFHLPSDPDEAFREGEYVHTTRELERAWREGGGEGAMILEQDFSPTLAGTDEAHSKRLVLKWLRESPARVKAADPNCVLGVKAMNAMFEDDFQLEMMRALVGEGSPADYLICFNRLFDPERVFGDKTGIAYGGPDLSDRNLWTLRRCIEEGSVEPTTRINATGDIGSGRMMVEYALRGATGGQLHTFFQLPRDRFRLTGVSRSRAALHELFFHPETGLVAAMCCLRERADAAPSKPFAFLDLPALGREMIMNKKGA